MIRDANIPYVENPRLVRGLDYYNLSVFEWVTQELGAQGTVCGGGRYDGLIEQLKLDELDSRAYLKNKRIWFECKNL